MKLRNRHYLQPQIMPMLRIVASTVSQLMKQISAISYKNIS